MNSTTADYSPHLNITAALELKLQRGPKIPPSPPPLSLVFLKSKKARVRCEIRLNFDNVKVIFNYEYNFNHKKLYHIHFLVAFSFKHQFYK